MAYKKNELQDTNPEIIIESNRPPKIADINHPLILSTRNVFKVVLLNPNFSSMIKVW